MPGEREKVNCLNFLIKAKTRTKHHSNLLWEPLRGAVSPRLETEPFVVQTHPPWAAGGTELTPGLAGTKPSFLPLPTLWWRRGLLLSGRSVASPPVAPWQNCGGHADLLASSCAVWSFSTGAWPASDAAGSILRITESSRYRKLVSVVSLLQRHTDSSLRCCWS